MIEDHPIYVLCASFCYKISLFRGVLMLRQNELFPIIQTQPNPLQFPLQNMLLKEIQTEKKIVNKY